MGVVVHFHVRSNTIRPPHFVDCDDDHDGPCELSDNLVAEYVRASDLDALRSVYKLAKRIRVVDLPDPDDPPPDSA